MEREYKILTKNEVAQLDWENEEDKQDFIESLRWADDPDWESALVLIEHCLVTRVLYTDGGEPEDMYLARDLSWIPDELNALLQ